MTGQRKRNSCDGTPGAESVVPITRPGSDADSQQQTIRWRIIRRWIPLRLIEGSRSLSRQAISVGRLAWAHARRRQAKRAAMRTLYAMDERLLRDAGIERDQIALVVEALLDARARPTGEVIVLAAGTPENDPGGQGTDGRSGDKAA